MCVISDTSWEEAEDVIADHNDEVMTTWRDLRWRPRREKKTFRTAKQKKTRLRWRSKLSHQEAQIESNNQKLY